MSTDFSMSTPILLGYLLSSYNSLLENLVPFRESKILKHTCKKKEGRKKEWKEGRKEKLRKTKDKKKKCITYNCDFRINGQELKRTSKQTNKLKTMVNMLRAPRKK